MSHIAWPPLLTATCLLIVPLLHPFAAAKELVPFRPSEQSNRASSLPTFKVAAFSALYCVLLGFFLFPDSATSMAARIGAEQHIASYVIGPALYRFHASLVPGIDYHSHYSVLTGPVFFNFLTTSFLDTVENYVWLLTSVVFVFYVTAFAICVWLLRSVTWAIGVTTTAVVLNLQMD
jgi:hypothetical protein